MTTPGPLAFASRWCAQWNAHDLEGLLAHHFGARVREVLTFVGELVSEGHGTYLVEDSPAANA